jgi:predicted transcriptional regulator
MKLLVDLENWEHYLKNPDDIVEETKTIATNKLTLTNLELELLNFIKTEKPQSIRELARMIHKDISIIRPKIKTLENTGLIELKQGSKNRLIPSLNYDKITVAI